MSINRIRAFIFIFICEHYERRVKRDGNNWKRDHGNKVKCIHWIEVYIPPSHRRRFLFIILFSVFHKIGAIMLGDSSDEMLFLMLVILFFFITSLFTLSTDHSTNVQLFCQVSFRLVSFNDYFFFFLLCGTHRVSVFIKILIEQWSQNRNKISVLITFQSSLKKQKNYRIVYMIMDHVNTM